MITDKQLEECIKIQKENLFSSLNSGSPFEGQFLDVIWIEEGRVLHGGLFFRFPDADHKNMVMREIGKISVERFAAKGYAPRVPDAVIAVADTWYSTPPKEEYEQWRDKYKHVSDDPNHRQAYLVIGLAQDGRSRGGIYPYEGVDGFSRIVADDILEVGLDSGEKKGIFDPHLLQEFMCGAEEYVARHN